MKPDYDPYYDAFNEDGTPKNELSAYSQWVEGKILTKDKKDKWKTLLALKGRQGR